MRLRGWSKCNTSNLEHRIRQILLSIFAAHVEARDAAKAISKITTDRDSANLYSGCIILYNTQLRG